MNEDELKVVAEARKLILQRRQQLWEQVCQCDSAVGQLEKILHGTPYPPPASLPTPPEHRRPEQPVVTRTIVTQRVEDAGDNKSVTPLSEQGIAIGQSLGEPFTPTDLRARLDGPSTRSYTWIAAWKNKGWIDMVGFGQYRRTANFGG